GMTDAAALPADDTPPAVLRARELVLRHGWNATAYQLLNPGLRLWFPAAGDAVVGWANAYGVRVVAGAPVCAKERLVEVADEFEADRTLPGRRVCYFGAGSRLEAAVARAPVHTAVLLGAQPAWRPADFAAVMDGHASLRAQLARARHKGV